MRSRMRLPEEMLDIAAVIYRHTRYEGAAPSSDTQPEMKSRPVETGAWSRLVDVYSSVAPR